MLHGRPQHRRHRGAARRRARDARADEHRHLLGGHEGTYAAKTGFTLAAGPCVATAVNRDDMVGRLAFRQDGAVLREGDLVATEPLKVS